ncbi:hypothetical protein F5Y11DRAFT_112475 [Daldinia sp. FL1419]|nr:hypothetical protein F5Y11DRAFT_112475 [Daldinia sp. FL1419]
MATIKKRKLNISGPPQAMSMSAFALRKRLLNQQTPTASSNIDAYDEAVSTPEAQPTLESSVSTRTRSSKKAKKVSNVEPTPKVGHEPNIAVKETLAESVSPSTDNAVVSNSCNGPSKSPTPSIDDDEILVKPSKALPAQLSNFKPSKSNYQRRKDGKILLKLSDGERLVILGSYGIHVTSGEITINSATLRKSDKIYWVDAPHCHALPVLRCSDNASLELLPHPIAASLRGLGKLAPQFRKLWDESSISPKNATSPSPTFAILYTSADGPKKTALQDLVSPPEWNREIAKSVEISRSKPCSFMITGPKGSGKSTFGKLLANRLITDQSSNSKGRVHRGVAVLDLDPGQPEYCIAGQVALVFVTEPVFNPSFCRPLSCSKFQIIRTHALASISPASDPELYLEAAMDLMTHYRNALGRHPLIINTPGWIQGTGLDLLTSLITSSRPTEVIYMSESGPAEAVETLQESCRSTIFSTLPSQPSQLISRTSAHLRSMQTMSYFHAEPHSPSSFNENWIQWNNKPLTTMPPWQVSYKAPSRGIFGIICYDYQTPLDLVADSINGTILAVVGVESAQAFRGSEERANLPDDLDYDTMDIDRADEESQKPMSSSFSALAEDILITTPEGIPYINTANGMTLDPKYSHCLGLALVRGIDIENGTLQLLTPLEAERIEEVILRGGEIVLVSGKFDTPNWAYTEELYYRAREEANDGVDVDETMEIGDEVGDISEADNDDLAGSTTDATSVPWVEVLHGNQKRGVGSKVWRVRRDLGRAG